MCGSLAIARSLRSGVGALVLVAVLLAGHRAAFAQCVGDCGDDGMVSIGDLILGVNISLGLQPPTACPAFQDAEGKVSIAQLIRGVNNSLEGCPMTPGPTATETATEVSPTSTATATDTLTPSSDSTATSTAAVSATATSTALASATATSTTAASPNATQAGTATATASVTTTHTPGPSPTPSQTLSPSVTATSTPPATATFTDTATPSTPASGTFTATPTVTATPTETEFPIGVFAGGKLPIVSAGFGAIQSIVAGLLAQLTNQGPIALTAGVVMPSVDPCPLMGTTSQECTEMGSGDDKTIHLVISADGCTVPGPFNGTEEFSGVITIDADPSSSNSCGRPFHFKSGTVHIEGPPPGDGPTLPFLTDVRADGNQDARQIFANLDGTIALSIPTPAPTCLANGVTLTLGGELRTELVFGTEVQAILNDITAVMDQITFNAYCVPVDYRLKLNGPASFVINVPAPALTTQSGLIGDQGSFSATFSNDFLVHQNATDNPAKVDMIGTMSSDCFGGDVDVLVISPIVVQADQVCPDEGIARVTSGAIMAELTYDQGGVTVDQDGNQDTVFCLAPELLLCPPM